MRLNLCIFILLTYTLTLYPITKEYQYVSPENMVIAYKVIDRLNIKKNIKFGNDPEAGSAISFPTQNVVILNEHDFNDLSQEEQEFIIAHEIAHIELNHLFDRRPLPLKSSILFVACMGAAIVLDHFIAKASQSKNSIFKHRLMKLIPTIPLFVGSCIFTNAVYTSHKLRKQEFGADEYAARGLGTTQGAINYFTRPTDSRFHKITYWLTTHPTHNQRIQRLRQLQKQLDKK